MIRDFLDPNICVIRVPTVSESQVQLMILLNGISDIGNSNFQYR